MWFYTRTHIFSFLFVFTYSLPSQKLLLKIEYNERGDKQTTVNEINITFINKTGEREYRGVGLENDDIKSQLTERYGSKIGPHKLYSFIEKQEDQTACTKSTYVLNPLEFKNKQFEARTFVEYTNKYDAQNINRFTNIDNVAEANLKVKQSIQHLNSHHIANRNREDADKKIDTNIHFEAKTNGYPLRTTEDYSNIDMNIMPFLQKQDHAERIKNNLGTFAMIRKEKHVSTPIFDFPVDNFDINYLKFNQNNEMKAIPMIKRYPTPSSAETNIRSKSLREITYNDGFPIVNYGNYFNKRRHLNDNNYNQMKHNNDIQNYNLGIKYDGNDKSNRFDRNHNDIDYYRNVERGHVDITTPEYDRRNLYNEENNNLRKRHNINDYNYYKMNQHNNEIDYRHQFVTRNFEKTNFYNKENHNVLNNYNGINQNYNNNDDYNKELREKDERNQIYKVLSEQNKLIEKIADRLMKDKIKRDGNDPGTTLADFDDIVKSLEMKNYTSSSITKPSTTTIKLPTLISLIDETEIRKALKQDPFVKRILKMANQKKVEYEKQIG